MLILTSNKPSDLIDTLVDHLDYEQLLNLYMTMTCFQHPSISVQDLYAQALVKGVYMKDTKDTMKLFLEDIVSCPTHLLVGDDTMKKVDYTDKVFNQALDEYFKTDKFKQWANNWFPDNKKEDDKH